MGLMPRANPALAKSRREAATARSLAALQAAVMRDPTTITLYTQKGLQVDSFAIVDEAVGTVALGDLAVTTAKIGNSQVTTAKIGNAQVTDAKIGNVSEGKITWALSGDAGAATGEYLTITDGAQTFKVALLDNI